MTPEEQEFAAFFKAEIDRDIRRIVLKCIGISIRLVLQLGLLAFVAYVLWRLS